MTAADRKRWDGVDRRRPPIVHIGARFLAHGRRWYVSAIDSKPGSKVLVVEMLEE